MYIVMILQSSINWIESSNHGAVLAAAAWTDTYGISISFLLDNMLYTEVFMSKLNLPNNERKDCQIHYFGNDLF